jgi:hypothetical protein
VAGLLHRRHVGQRELGVDHLDVGDRIDLVRDVDHVVVLEAAHDVGDRVGLADVGEELVAEALALRGAGDEARDVDELHDRGSTFCGLAICASFVRRGSGTSTMPTLGSMVQNG